MSVWRRCPVGCDAHPYQPESTLQGLLQLLYELQQYLGEISGLPAVSLQPAAGAHGELDRPDGGRRVISERGAKSGPKC